MKTYLVGGAVRDELLGRTVRERDWVVVGATPEVMEQQGFKAVGKDFPVFLHPKTKEEYALARTERKSGHGYKGFEFYAAAHVTLAEDLQRRDLTVNAIAQDEAGNLIDPYGGQQDLAARVLRHVSPAFAEDPVRILRVARFAARLQAYGFTIAPETQQLMRQMVAQGEVEYLVPERVWQELSRALAEKYPVAFIKVLRECGALKALFPEIDNLYGVPNPPKWHPEVDSGVHTELVLQQAALLSAEPRVRFAALLHDLGKALTPAHLLPSHPGHGPRGVPLIEAICERYRVPKSYRELAILVAKYHIESHSCRDMQAKGLLKLLNHLDVLRRPERVEEFLTTCLADVRGRTGFEQAEYPQADYLRQAIACIGKIDPKSWIDQKMDGVKIKQRLHDERLVALKKILNKSE